MWLIILIFLLLAGLAIGGALMARAGRDLEESVALHEEEIESLEQELDEVTRDLLSRYESMRKNVDNLTAALANSQKAIKLHKQISDSSVAQLEERIKSAVPPLPIACSCCRAFVARYQETDWGPVCLNCIREKELGRNG